MKIKEMIQGIIAVGVLIGMIMGGISYFATASDLRLVELRLEQKIVNDQIMQLKQRMWQLEDRNKSKDCIKWEDDKDKQEYRILENTLEELKKEKKK